MTAREIVWNVTAAQFETLGEYARQLENAEVSQQEYLERLRQLGMPEAGPGCHVRIVLTRSTSSLSVPAAKLRAGQLPGLPH